MFVRSVDRDNKTTKLANSWGDGWGDRGLFRQAVANNCDACSRMLEGHLLLASIQLESSGTVAISSDIMPLERNIFVYYAYVVFTGVLTVKLFL